MAAILFGIQPGDEIIAPSFTFVSTVNAFVLRGGRIRFADSCKNNPNIDPDSIESLITSKTKAIAVVHYGGIACDMDKIMHIAKKHRIFVVEDAAHALDAHYKGKPLGSIGHVAAFSFHETKNITSGEGGMLVINDRQFLKRAEIIREKGTNRSAFFRGEANKYGWVDIGSSFLPSDITAAFLYAQLENLDIIQQKRKKIWERYRKGLRTLVKKGKIKLLSVPSFAEYSAHVFPIFCRSMKERDALLLFLKKNGIHATFHYLPLHRSKYYRTIEKKSFTDFPNASMYANTIVRLPIFRTLLLKDQKHIIRSVLEFFEKKQ